MLRWSVLAAAIVLNAPTLWRALGTGQVPVSTAIVHVLVTVVIVGVLLGGVRMAAAKKRPVRRVQPPPAERP